MKEQKLKKGMDLFKNQEEFDRVLAVNKAKPLLFTLMRNSVSTVEAIISGAYIDESELTDIECEGQIVAIDSNFHHAKLASYKPHVRKKSNRGRKKQPKRRKARKLQGDGTCFNSQITFTIIGSHIRHNPLVEIAGKLQPLIQDPHTAKAKKLPGNRELVTKEYKIKVFRNGKISIPGVLTEDHSDITGPLDELCDYLSRLFGDPVELVSVKSVMNNYKLFVRDGKIDMVHLQAYCSKHFTDLVNTRFEDIKEFVLNPDYVLVSDALESHDQQPFHNMYLSGDSVVNIPGLTQTEELPKEDLKDNEQISIDYLALIQKLSEIGNPKNLYINFELLCSNIRKAKVVEVHDKVETFMENVYNKCFMNLGPDTATQIRLAILGPFLTDLEKKLSASKDNMLSYIRYNPERYTGFVIKVKTPTTAKPAKMTTIKIFPSGKINIDGAPDRKVADFIYYWLNTIFLENPQILYRDGEEYSDGEFSYTDSDEPPAE